MEKLIDLRQKANAKADGVELSAKCTNREAVKAMKKNAHFVGQTVWCNKLK